MNFNRCKIVLLIIGVFCYGVSTAQTDTPVAFNCKYGKGHDLVELIVTNKSSRTLYYSVTLDIIIDTAWIPELSDINSLGKNEFLFLKPLKPHQTVVASVSKKKIRFGLMYYEKQDLKSKGGIIYGPPLN